MTKKAKILIGSFIEKDNKVLLIKNKEGKWDLPISELDSGKNILTDLKADMKKILGTAIEPQAVTGIYEDIDSGFHLANIRIFFKAKPTGKIAEKLEKKWVIPSEVLAMNIREIGRIVSPMDDYMLGNFLPLEAIEKFKNV
jgi:hypothetical protein